MRKRLAAAGEEGVPHQKLNSWCIDRVVQAVADGSLGYKRPSPSTDTDEAKPVPAPIGGRAVVAEHEASGGREASDSVAAQQQQEVVIEQMVGRAGDVFLLHPWCIHSGTTNLSADDSKRDSYVTGGGGEEWKGRPRIMLNGMARLCGADLQLNCMALF
eukprot:COSAG05_NODE_105_length_18793_cov_115.346421_5_plen_159_part_00